MKHKKEGPLPFFLNPDVGKLEHALQMPPGFLNRLVEEDDWSFVVKSHALIESALSYLLRNQTDPRAADIFDGLPLRGGKASKIAFIKRLCPLDEAALRFVNDYSVLRNNLLHDVKNLGFTFPKYFESLNAQQRRQAVSSYTDLLGVPDEIIALPEREQFLQENTCEILVLSVMTIVSAAYFAVHRDEVEAAWEALSRTVAALILGVILALAKKPLSPGEGPAQLDDK